MFSSNQILEISGSLLQLKSCLDFALKLSGEDRYMIQSEIDRGCKLVYQITEDGKYCIGWGFEEVPKGWSEYPFKFDTEIVSKIIIQHIENFPVEYGGYDGSYDKGFKMKEISNSFSEEKNGIKNPFYGIVYFEPYTCFYAK